SSAASDVYMRQKYENKKIQKADDIIAIQAVICIVLAIGFFTANLFYPDICHDVYVMLDNLVKDKEHLVPYISDYI
ncbi:MAG: hypothetical protein K2G63_01710, partial [Oscillospiraceae bacterium]|nr:hypothetical protein [Oscillospiraceae bacterium]